MRTSVHAALTAHSAHTAHALGAFGAPGTPGTPGAPGTVRATRRRSRPARLLLGLGAVVALSLTAACGGSGDSSGAGDKSAAGGGGSAVGKKTVSLPRLKGQKLQVAAVWTGNEEKNFRKVLDEFGERTGAQVQFVPTGDDVATYIGSKVEGGSPPDVAMLPQVGVLHQFAQKGWIKPVDKATSAQLKKNYSKGWRALGSDGGKQYGVYFKAADKSLVWYNTSVYRNAGVHESRTWKSFLHNARTLADSGVPAVSVGGADGWVLTDWFENVYLSQAGPQKYDELARHKLKWTDPSVKKALSTLAGLFGEKELLAGGNKGALQTEFPKSVTQTFDPVGAPQAASVFEADFVGVNIAGDTKAKIGKDAKVYPFPSVGGAAPVVTGGDAAVVLKGSKAAHALQTFLASPDAAAIWARQGGYISPDRNLTLSAYPNPVQRKIAKALVSAGDGFRFDMSDQAPAAFGGTKGEGEWKALQDFLKKPKDIAGTQHALETAASKAYAH